MDYYGPERITHSKKAEASSTGELWGGGIPISTCSGRCATTRLFLSSSSGSRAAWARVERNGYGPESLGNRKRGGTFRQETRKKRAKTKERNDHEDISTEAGNKTISLRHRVERRRSGSLGFGTLQPDNGIQDFFPM